METKEHVEFVSFTSGSRVELVELNEYVYGFVEKYRIAAGQITVISPHTTGAIIVNEKESGLNNDIVNFLTRVIPRSAPDRIIWEHDNFASRTENMCKGEKLNGQSHLVRLFLPRDQTIYIVNGFPILGQWEELFFVELDGPRYRNVVFKISAR